MVAEEEMEMGFEATELRLGLPSSREEAEVKNSSKRGFLETMDLNLKLETSNNSTENSARLSPGSVSEGMSRVASQKSLQINSNIDDPAKPSALKSQVVGWPPVRSYRKSLMSVQSGKGSKQESSRAQAAFVKVSMDGAPYLRKVDLKVYHSYQELYMSLEKMFSSSTIQNCGSQDLLNGSEYVPTYEDKDGDWMLVGDVPWEMFVESCKRLRIMKGSEAVGLAPRTVEKCKNRS